MQLTLNVPAVAGFGTRLATWLDRPEAQVPEKKGLKEVAERVTVTVIINCLFLLILS